MSMNPPGPEQPPQPGYQPPPATAHRRSMGTPVSPRIPRPPRTRRSAAYPAAPPPTGQYAAPPPAAPGRTLGIVAFILSFFIALVGLILGIVALVQSRKAGQKNGFALAAIIISAVLHRGRHHRRHRVAVSPLTRCGRGVRPTVRRVRRRARTTSAGSTSTLVCPSE